MSQLSNEELVFMNRRKQLRHKCIDYAIVGYNYLKNKKLEQIVNIQVKRHLINETDPNYDPYHYYIEIKVKKNENQLRKVIIDNEGSYNFYFYKDRYKPKKIQKIGHKNLQNAYKLVENDFIKIVENDIDYNLRNI